MKINKFFILLIFSIALIYPLSCKGKKDNIENHKGSLVDGALKSSTEQSSTNSSINASTSPREEALALLRKQGFYVFDFPQDSPEFSNIPALNSARAGLEKISKTDLKDKVIILNFWATWCPPCRVEMPSLENLNEEMKDYDFKIVAISVGEKFTTVRDFINSESYTFPVFIDEKMTLGSSMASQGIPTTYILDKNSKIIAGVVGAREYDNIDFIAAMKLLANE